MRSAWVFPAMLLAVLNHTAEAQRLTGDEILRRCEEVSARIEDFTVELSAKIDMERMRIPQMKATMFYKKPDKVHFESEGFMMLPREGFAMPVSVLLRNYAADLQGRETLDGSAVYRLQLTAKSPTSRVPSITLWVDGENFTIVRSSSTPYRGRSVDVRFEYRKLEDRFWLPARLTATFTAAGEDTSETGWVLKPQLEEFRRPPRNGSVEVVYENYRVNTGLTDDLFDRKNE